MAAPRFPVAGRLALNGSGQATCTTAFTTEGDHDLSATYSGTSSFATSQTTLTQEVDNHTVVSGSTYSNPGQISIPDTGSPPAPAAPYPSHIFVSGLTGTITHISATLSGLTDPVAQDLDMLLVGPAGGSGDPPLGCGPKYGDNERHWPDAEY